MRPIHLAQADKTRPVVILTRELARVRMTKVTVAPITGTIRGLHSEVRVGVANGLQHESVISCDNVATIPSSAIGRLIGYLTPEQDRELARALRYAYDLREFG